jgi:hypothetical protein
MRTSYVETVFFGGRRFCHRLLRAKWWRLLPSQEGLRKFLALIFAECQLLKDSVNADSVTFSIGSGASPALIAAPHPGC